MKHHFLLLLSCLVFSIVTAQKAVVSEYAETDKLALQLPDSMSHTTDDIARFIAAHFKTDKSKLRAIFTWIAGNIQYDVANMFAINFYEGEQERVDKALQKKMGICSNFAALFHAVCLKSGIESYVITGYTKQNGFTDYIPHAWCAAAVGNNWYMFDPTWGSGYISGGKFYHKFNYAYFMADPATLIKSHMPFDYLWQFLNYPVSSQEFYENKTALNRSKPFFNYVDSIRAYEEQDSSQRMVTLAARIEKNGVKNSLVFDQLQHIKIQIENNTQRARVEAENNRQRAMADAFNGATTCYNTAINNVNAFIDYRNKQFMPEKPDAIIQSMLDTASGNLKKAREKLNSIHGQEGNNALLVSQQEKAVESMEVHIKEQQDWLNVYFSKSKSKRKAMFYERKTTLFGIPLK